MGGGEVPFVYVLERNRECHKIAVSNLTAEIVLASRLPMSAVQSRFSIHNDFAVQNICP